MSVINVINDIHCKEDINKYKKLLLEYIYEINNKKIILNYYYLLLFIQNVLVFFIF